MSMMIKVADERGAQLRQFADALGLPISEAIGVLLKSAGAADEVPGFQVIPVRSKISPGFLFRFDDFDGLLFDAKDFTELADIIDHCATTTGTGGKRLASEPQRRELIIARHRRHSITIVGKSLDTDRETTRTLTLDIARDLAQQIRKSIADA